MKRRGEEEVTIPLAFIHPCWKGGCTAYAAFGYGAAISAEHQRLGLWTCQTHRAELEDRLNGKSTPRDDNVPATPTAAETPDDDEGNGTGSLFDGA